MRQNPTVSAVITDEARRYTVVWRRPGESDWLSCSGLDLRTAVARAIKVARQHGHVEVKSLARDAKGDDR